MLHMCCSVSSFHSVKVQVLHDLSEINSSISSFLPLRLLYFLITSMRSPTTYTATSPTLILPLPLWCQVLDAFLRQHGSEDGGDYFLGGTYSAAETITTPFVRRMLVALPVLRDVDVAAIVKAEKLERLERWFQVRW